MKHNAHLQLVTRDDTSDSSTTKPIARTAAQRQRAYRLRRKRAVIDAIGEEACASRVAMLALLGEGLAALDNSDTSTRLIESKRHCVRRVLQAIVTRYAIDLTD
ncbi:hypothetical protein [Paraburkholderia sp. RL17-337-BIB-A]|uniref:hypothetical protein n=1 Tax=Paraburkholderia sp. RL17-337-BIB-A TaxID=3031636 RepID=UPI0038B8D446